MAECIDKTTQKQAAKNILAFDEYFLKFNQNYSPDLSAQTRNVIWVSIARKVINEP